MENAFRYFSLLNGYVPANLEVPTAAAAKISLRKT